MERKNYLIGRAFKSFLLASVLTVAATQTGALIDGLMISHLIDAHAMGGVNISAPVLQGMFAMCMLLGAGSSMMVGEAIGGSRRREADSIFTAVITVAVAIGVVLMVVGLAALDPLVRFLCPEEGMREVTADYLGVTLYSAACYMVFILMEMFVAVDGSPRCVTYAVVASAVSNLLLDYVFIALCGWAVKGAAWATVISYVVALLFLLPHFKQRDTLRLCFSSMGRWIGKAIGKGLPFGIATSLIAVQMWGANSIAMSYFGGYGIIALTVCMYLLRLSMIILTGTMKAYQPVASILKGVGDGIGVLMVTRRAYRFMTLCLLLFVLPLLLCPEWIAGAFGIDDGEGMAFTAGAIPPFAFNIVLQCLIYLLIPIYQLFGRGRMATFISVSQSLMPMFGMWLLAAVVPQWVWWGFAMGQLVVLAFTMMFAAVVRHADGNLVPLVLVPKPEKGMLYETSASYDIHEMAMVLRGADAFLRQHVADDHKVSAVVLTSEELLKNVITYGFDNERKARGHYIDYRLSVTPNGVVRMVISDDGKPFNPLEHKGREGYGLPIVKGLCKDMKYSYLFRQNSVAAVFE